MAIKHIEPLPKDEKTPEEILKETQPSKDILEQIYTDPVACANSESIVNLIYENGWYGAAICQAMEVEYMILTSKKYPDGFRCSIGTYKDRPITVLERIEMFENGEEDWSKPEFTRQPMIAMTPEAALEGISMDTYMPAAVQKALMKDIQASIDAKIISA